jgi:HrpA-like RNA helicase
MEQAVDCTIKSRFQQKLGCSPAGSRKVILATNIAETSVTFSDVVYVVDGARANVATFDPVNNTPQLGPQVGSGHRANVATFDPVNNTPQLGPQVGAG